MLFSFCLIKAVGLKNLQKECLCYFILHSLWRKHKVICYKRVIHISTQIAVNFGFGCQHKWGGNDSKKVTSICTLCNKCCTSGDDCPKTGTEGDSLRVCPCDGPARGCRDCGICTRCTKALWVRRCSTCLCSFIKVSSVVLIFEVIMYITINLPSFTKYHKCGHFHVGVIFAFFTILTFSRKFPLRENETHMTFRQQK